jgi:tRNA uracil 4-sulfurtransferase
MKRYLLIHYGELGLKKANKPYFVEKLRKAVRVRLEKRFSINFRVKHVLSRFMVLLPDGFIESEYVEVLGKIAGIKNFSFVFESGIELADLGSKIWNTINTDEVDLTGLDTFRVRVKRSMILPYKSIEAEREIGAILLRNGLDLKVKLKGSDFFVDIEFFNEHGYFSFKRYPGLAGMPPNSQSKLVSLISSGIDSPVASFMMMRRGARVIFVHCHGYPFTDKSELEQVKEIVEILSAYQFDTKLYLVPFGQLQKVIATTLDVPAKMRTVLYRRAMLRVAEKISKKDTAKGLITGDCFGQVASQTPENIFAVHDASSIPLLQPLIAFDKEDVIKLAEKIGTFEISKQPCKDSCTMFMPRRPELKANVFDTQKYEELYPLDDLVDKVIEESEVIYFD